jgi:predicted RNA-binding protein with PUA-like domain
MKYWLIKSEGDCYSIDDFEKDCAKIKKNNAKKSAAVAWTGIRNFQARNYMRDGMEVGDRVLFYHSNGEPSGIYGIARVASGPHVDESALDPDDEHYDPKAVEYARSGKEPLWMCVDMEFIKKLGRPVSLDEIKKSPHLRGMLVARPAQRLSVMPVEEKHFKEIVELGN